MLSLLRSPRRTPLVMGVVNATPDSFHPASRARNAAQAADLALRLREEGADLIDLGGQSTRPGSDPVNVDEELRRVISALEALDGRLDVPISIDTDKAVVARAALGAGAAMINDVSAFRNDPDMAEACLKAEAVILMHRGGASPKTMQDNPRFADVVGEVKEFLKERISCFRDAGGEAARVLIDPGIGFGKDLEHNLSLIKHVGEFSSIAPVVLGVSRKSFLGKIMDAPTPEDRLEGSLAVACWAALQGVRVLRVHDVAATRRALAAWDAVSAAK